MVFIQSLSAFPSFKPDVFFLNVYCHWFCHSDGEYSSVKYYWWNQSNVDFLSFILRIQFVFMHWNVHDITKQHSVIRIKWAALWNCGIYKMPAKYTHHKPVTHSNHKLHSHGKSVKLFQINLSRPKKRNKCRF